MERAAGLRGVSPVRDVRRQCPAPADTADLGRQRGGWPYLEGPTVLIDERDIAAVAVRALGWERHAGAEYVLTGPQSLTHFEQLSAMGRATGRALRIEEMSPDEARREWRWPASAVNMLRRS